MSLLLVLRLPWAGMNSTSHLRVVFVDLDGTMILDNSFHSFLRATWSVGGFPLRVTIVAACLTRAIRRGGRAAMKRSILRGFAKAPQYRQAAVVRRTLAMMTATLSEPIHGKLADFAANGWTIVLATAAPDCYARPFAEAQGFDACLASPDVNSSGEWNELMGTRKANACLAWTALRSEEGPSEIAVLSDHSDDLPLLRMASVVVIQAKTESSARIASELSPATRIEQIDPIAEECAGGIWLWIDDLPSGPHDSWEIRTILSKHRYALHYVGNGKWKRIRPGESLEAAVPRLTCPRPPTTGDRIGIIMKRKVVRDLLGIFH